ncbi:hypothetical protein HK105_203892 [Polyrhizophydium stewartii]|uniref:Uncharacterized protein n=1 Tax=Polyrhizophydium stewartii TaxID=2732419 RepID=A0ABR4NAI7_9FUNG|nr:hypothetical protein HK105_002331 [Polyrhizophydium stewartii]
MQNKGSSDRIAIESDGDKLSPRSAQRREEPAGKTASHASVKFSCQSIPRPIASAEIINVDEDVPEEHLPHGDLHFAAQPHGHGLQHQIESHAHALQPDMLEQQHQRLQHRNHDSQHSHSHQASAPSQQDASHTYGRLSQANAGISPAAYENAPPQRHTPNSPDAAIMSSGNLVKLRPEMRASSIATSDSTNSRFPTAREVSETTSTKLYEMRWCCAAAILNSVMILIIVRLQSGIIIPIGGEISTSIGCVILELVLLISNFVTSHALDGGASAFFGEKLASKKGYSLAVCGFLQVSTFLKLPFANQLSLNSTCRKLLARSSLLWITLHAILWLTPLTATALKGDVVRLDQGTIQCVVYRQRGRPLDRKWPTLTVENGVSEFIFGSALGVMRSENPGVNVTTAIIAPQFISDVGDGDKVVGPGFSADISTNCECAPSIDLDGLSAVGVSSNIAPSLLAEYAGLNGGTGMANAFINGTSSLNIITMLSRTNICGGINETNTFVPVCFTEISNHRHAEIMIQYMSDGTMASIAPRQVEIRSLLGAADLQYWLSNAMNAILEGPFSHTRLPPTFPGAVNPLLWWATPNLIALDPSLIEAGIETMFAVLLRAGVQRTYISEGDTCVHNMEILGVSSLDLADYGANVAIFILSFQLFATAVTILCYIPWLLSPNPIGPAVRLTRDHVYFTTMLNSSSISGGTEMLCNAPPHAIWQAYDTIVRVGEPIGTRNDPIFGHVTLDRPKLLTHLTNGKRYY